MIGKDFCYHFGAVLGVIGVVIATLAFAGLEARTSRLKGEASGHAGFFRTLGLGVFLATVVFILAYYALDLLKVYVLNLDFPVEQECTEVVEPAGQLAIFVLLTQPFAWLPWQFGRVHLFGRFFRYTLFVASLYCVCMVMAWALIHGTVALGMGSEIAARSAARVFQVPRLLEDPIRNYLVLVAVLLLGAAYTRRSANEIERL